MSIFSFLRSQAKGLFLALAVVFLLGMVWAQTKPPTPLPAPTGAVSTGAGTAAVTMSTDTPPKTLPDSPADKPADPAGAPADASASTTTPPTESPGAKSKDDELRALMLGCWFHVESGDHWIENFPDGTSRLLLKLDFVSSLLYGKQIEMDLTWEVKDGVLTHTIVKGNPQANVDSLVKDFGRARSSDILELTPERMLLGALGKKPKKDLWTRSPLPKEWENAKTK